MPTASASPILADLRETGSPRLAAAARSYAEVRAELDDRRDLALAIEALRAGRHLWIALIEESRFAAVDAVAADMAELPARLVDPRLADAWIAAVNPVLSRLPHAARSQLLARSERLAAVHDQAFAAAVARLHGDALAASAYQNRESVIADIARMQQFVGTRAALLDIFADSLGLVATLITGMWPGDPQALAAVRTIVATLEPLGTSRAAAALSHARLALPETAAAERARLDAQEIAAVERDPVCSQIEAALVQAGFPAPRELSADTFLVCAAWFPLERRRWLLHFDAETGSAPHTEHGALLLKIAASLGRAVTVEEDAWVPDHGWRLVFTAPERHVLESAQPEPDDWVDVGLLFRAARIVAGGLPLFELATDDQTVTLLCPPPAAATALERGGWLEHCAVRARPLAARRSRP